MKITKVEALYLRQPEVKDQCDSGQDAVVVRVETDAGITGLGEVDSAPLAGAVFAFDHLWVKATVDRGRSV